MNTVSKPQISAMNLVFIAMGILLFPIVGMVPLQARDRGREIYMQRCFWCHGEEGRGDGPSAAGMFPRPRNFVQADYRIRSTAHGELPTDEDLFRVITRGLPGTPMPGWEEILSEEERRLLVATIKSFSPRFGTERPNLLKIPVEKGSAIRGKEIFRTARCFVCHGKEGRASGELTAALNYEWGLPYTARDFTRGWTFKGGHEPRDIYLRITGGLNGTPMGPYQDLLSDQQRWDLAHYVAALSEETEETSDDFVVAAAYTRKEIPTGPDAELWQKAHPILVPLAGQVVLDPPLRWWMPTVGTASVKALWNGRSIGFLLEWNDPTGSDNRFADSAMLQFASLQGGKPYFLFGGNDNPVKVWQWQTGDRVEEWTSTGNEAIESQSAGFRVHSDWKEGKWRVVFRSDLGDEPKFAPDSFVPILLSIRDGANAERGRVRAISTWLYATLERAPSLRPWLSAVLWLLGAVIAELWIVQRLNP